MPWTKKLFSIVGLVLAVGWCVEATAGPRKSADSEVVVKRRLVGADGVPGTLRINGKLTARKRKAAPGIQTVILNPMGPLHFPTSFTKNGHVLTAAYNEKGARFELTFEAQGGRTYEVATRKEARFAGTMGSGNKPDTVLHEVWVGIVDTATSRVVAESRQRVGIATIIYNDGGENPEIVKHIYSNARNLLGGQDCDDHMDSRVHWGDLVVRIAFVCPATGWGVPTLANADLASAVLDR